MKTSQNYIDCIETLKDENTLSELRDKLEKWQAYSEDDIRTNMDLVKELFLYDLQLDSYISAVEDA